MEAGSKAKVGFIVGAGPRFGLEKPKIAETSILVTSSPFPVTLLGAESLSGSTKSHGRFFNK